MIPLGWPSPAAARRPLPEGEAKLAAQSNRAVFGGNWADDANNSKRYSAARQRVFDQVVNIVEGDVVDGPLNLEKARRLAF